MHQNRASPFASVFSPQDHCKEASAGITFVREKRRSLAILDCKDIAYHGAMKNDFVRERSKIVVATAEDRAILVHSAAHPQPEEFSYMDGSSTPSPSRDRARRHLLDQGMASSRIPSHESHRSRGESRDFGALSFRRLQALHVYFHPELSLRTLPPMNMHILLVDLAPSSAPFMSKDFLLLFPHPCCKDFLRSQL